MKCGFVIVMIKCDRISKYYDGICALDAFCYTFEERGFYLLFGESGCGKTTLINVLSGMIPYDEGTVTVDGLPFSGCIDPNCYDGRSDYITQDPFFVDFLTVRENMEVFADNEEAIKAGLGKFGLQEKECLPVTVLSGGECQRLALARSFITEKKILFLDEPTASLDEENKRNVFELIKKLSENCLVICASHDAVAREYADEVIRLKKSRKASCIQKETVQEKNSYTFSKKKNLDGLPSFLRKWFSSDRRRRKTDVILGTFLVLAMMLCLLADTPQGKRDSNIEYVYKINSLELQTTSDDEEYFASLEGKYGITEVILLYNVPFSPPDKDDILVEGPDYEVELEVIPFEADVFRLSNRIETGTYFKEKNDIVLSSEMADSLARGNWESLIGMKVPVKVYGKGVVEFNVVGIFGEMNDFERQYLSSSNTKMAAGDSYRPESYKNLFYVNSLFMDDYFYDEDFYYGYGQRGYQLYFDSYKSLVKYTKMHDESYGRIRVGIFTDGISDLFDMMAYILLPLAALIIMLSILFYGNLIRTELVYNGRFFSVFNYAGYDMQDIIKCFARLNAGRLMVICSVSTLITLLITSVINGINVRKVYIGFQIFTYNPLVILSFIGLLLVFSWVSVKMALRKVKAMSWYENIIASRDLL